MKKLKQLKSLDKSIEKYKDVVYKRKYTKICPLCVFNEQWEKGTHFIACDFCIIAHYTKEQQCYNTSFYETSVYILCYQSFTNKKVTKKNRIADNHMLSELYEIRRRYIADAWKGEE